MQKEGQIKVSSENIFPIIKNGFILIRIFSLEKLLQTLVMLLRNIKAFAALARLKMTVLSQELRLLPIRTQKTLTVTDNGIGMTADEVEKYITQIAFSGAEEFIEKYKDKSEDNAGIIGHFGLGFYSSYMVSESVEIETLSYQPNSQPVHWVSDGSTTYEITDGTRTQHGTSIIMHITEDEEEFLDKDKLRDLLLKYCHFMPYEIYLNPAEEEAVVTKDADGNEIKHDAKPVNNTTPLWLKAPRDCTDEEYKEFYVEAFHDFNEPLFWIHLNVDYPFNLKGILYFPKQTDKLQVMPGEIKLYSNQVYIADNIKEVVPEFLMLLKGVIDCPDIPLNVSRSFLQNDGEVAKISKHITKKVADKLSSMFKNDRETYEKYWDDIAPFIKFGCIKDEKFYDRVKDIILFKTISGEYKTFCGLSKAGRQDFLCHR